MSEHTKQNRAFPDTEVYLGQLPGQAESPQDAPVPDHHGLHNPAGKMGEGEPVQMTPQPLDGQVRAVDRVLLREKTKTKTKTKMGQA